MKNDFLTAILQITDEKKLSKDVVIGAIESALTATYKRNIGQVPDVHVRLNEQTGEFRIFAEKRVVIEVRDPRTELSLKDAQEQPSRGDIGDLFRSRAFIGYVLCQVLASQIIFVFAGGGPYLVVTHMGRSSAEYGAWFATTGLAYLVGNLFCVRFAPRHSLEKLIWFGLALQVAGSLLNLLWGVIGLNQAPAWLFGTQMIVMVANAFVMSNSAAGAISVRPEAAGTASGAIGFLQMGLGSLFSQFGAWLGGHFATPVPLNIAVVMLSIACASTMIFLVPRRDVVVSEELIEKAEEEESGML